MSCLSLRSRPGAGRAGSGFLSLTVGAGRGSVGVWAEPATRVPPAWYAPWVRLCVYQRRTSREPGRPARRLPSERYLCEQLGISRSTLRRTLKELGEEGLVESSEPRGPRRRRAEAAARPERPLARTEHPAAAARLRRAAVRRQPGDVSGRPPRGAAHPRQLSPLAFAPVRRRVFGRQSGRRFSLYEDPVSNCPVLSAIPESSGLSLVWCEQTVRVFRRNHLRTPGRERDEEPSEHPEHPEHPESDATNA